MIMLRQIFFMVYDLRTIRRSHRGAHFARRMAECLAALRHRRRMLSCVSTIVPMAHSMAAMADSIGAQASGQWAGRGQASRAKMLSLIAAGPELSPGAFQPAQAEATFFSTPWARA